MLRELSPKPALPGQEHRRWFFCHDLDLAVWFDAAAKPVGFQLAYDKYRNERSISWRAERGFRHYAVDEGNAVTGQARTPLLYADGEFDPAPVIRHFRALSAELPAEIAAFVLEKLGDYPASDPP